MLMGVATGTVVAGKVHVEGMTLTEGATVTVLTKGPSTGVLLAAEDEAALLEVMAEADRGDTISADELFESLDRRANP
jgi:class 3 adenylate cyclase